MQITSNRHTLPYPADPAQLFARIRRRPWAMWLDSGCGNQGASRYDIMVASPVCTLVTRDGITRVGAAGEPAWTTGTDPLEILAEQLRRHGGESGPPPFGGGAVGYFSYELGRRFEGLPERPCREPQMAVGIYRWAVVLDRHAGRAWLTGPGADGDLAATLGNAQPLDATAPFTITGAMEPAMDSAGYAAAFRAVQHYIHEGDCYQVNLANRLRTGYHGDPFSAYTWLRHRAGGPFSAYLDVPGGQVLSLSPERFLSLCDGRVETWPIKGTRPRRSDPDEDAAECRALHASPKDRAENVMIVDLLRNDLGKVCRPGSVGVSQLCQLESFANVHHLVSRVEGQLRPGARAVDLLRACLPGGSITGAPKHRAMQIIDELEGHARGVYCGAIGYLGFDGAMDLNIAIRTATCVDGVMDYWAGGGLVADSNCAAEYAETQHKARAFLELLERGAGAAGSVGGQ